MAAKCNAVPNVWKINYGADQNDCNLVTES